MFRWIVTVAVVLIGGSARAQLPIEVCATTTTVASLVREVGGEDVSVTVFAKGTEDPHFVEPRPSFVKKLSDADLLVLNGMELEIGWLPPLVQGARNARVLIGARGYLDTSVAIEPLEVPTQFDRSMGDTHPYGNPHYLLDPLNGLAVARLIRDRLSELRPARAEAFARGYDDLARRIGDALVGEKLAARYDVAKLALLAEHGRLLTFLESQGESADLGGWLGLLGNRHGTGVVADHNLWPYFARRFGLRMVGYLEPKPGIPPTTTHLRRLIEQMREEQVGLILSAAYYDPARARFVSEQTRARVAKVAHAVGARPGTETYPKLIDYNVRQLVSDHGES